MEVLDEGEYPLPDGGIHLCRREAPEHRPFELPAGDRTLPDLDLFGKNAPVGPASMALPSRSAVNTSSKAEILEKFMSQKTY